MNKYVLNLEDGTSKTFEFIEPDNSECIVVAVARDENKYIKEWVEHYLNLGFDRIFIGDNNNLEDESLLEILKDFIDDGKVVILDCKGIRIPFQLEFYNMFSNNGNYKWAFYCDIDEFLELNAFENIKDFLEEKSEEKYIFFRWVSYGNNGIKKYEDRPVQERFKYPLPLMIPDNLRFKTIVRGGTSTTMEIHGPKVFDYDKVNMTYRDGYLKHYKYKSLEEQLSKDKKLAYTNENLNRREIADFANNTLYHNDLLNVYNDLRGEFLYFGVNSGKNVNYDARLFIYTYLFQHMPVNKDEAEKSQYFKKIMPIPMFICKDMSILRNKYFLITFNCSEEDFNKMFEMALHTKNKVCMTFPKINDTIIVTTIYL